MKVLILLNLKKYIMAKYAYFKIAFAVLAFLCIDFNVTAQSSITNLINCPSNINGDSLYINFAKIVNSNGNTEFKIKTICPSLTPHDNLDIDSVKIRVIVNSSDPNTMITFSMDSTVNKFFKVIDLELNNAIDIEIAWIDEGIILSNPIYLLDDGISGEVIKVFIDVYENSIMHPQLGMELTH